MPSRRARAGRGLVAVALVLGTCATVTAAAGPAPVDPSTYSFITAPTDQLGVPGYQAGSELTPDGGIYTGYGEVDWLAGPHLRSLPIMGRTLGVDGRSPLFVMEKSWSGVRYRITVLAAPVGREPVDFAQVEAQNLGSRPALAAWGSELLYSGGGRLGNGNYGFRFPPLIPEDPGWSDTRDGDWLTRGGEDMERLPSGGSSSAGRVEYRRRLAPGSSWTLNFAVPVIPVRPGSATAVAVDKAGFGSEEIQELAFWRRFFARGMQISLPESKVVDTFDASLVNMEESRYPAAGGSGWIQTPNKLAYNAFFIRDASFIARALDLAGYHREAAEDLDYFPRVQSPDGLFSSQPGELDGLGEALWSIGQHADWPIDGQRSFAARMLGPVERGVDWLASAAAHDPDGLVPASTVDDNELASGHLSGDDFLAADGLSAAIGLARVAGRADLADLWQRQLTTFLGGLHAALARAEALTGGWIPPTLEDNGGLDWGNLWGSYPAPVALAPDAPAVTDTLAHVIRGFRQGIATYRGMLHDYLGFRVFETELQRGEQSEVVAGLYAELAHTTATGGGFETDLLPGGGRKLVTNLAPHGWFAAEYVTLLRNMLVDESGPRVVDIMSALSPSWLATGDVISVRAAPTTDGTISFRLRSFHGGARLSWSDRLRPGAELRWPLPSAAGSRRTLTLRGSSGSVVVRWRLRGAVPSFAETAARLTAAGA